MAQGDVDVQIAATMTAAAIKTAVEDTITAIGVSGSIALTQLNDNREAVSSFEKAISLDPTYPRVHYDLGIASSCQILPQA